LNKQESGKELATLVVSSLWDALIFLILLGHLLGPIKALLLWARVLRDSVVVYNNNFKQVLTLYPRKIKNTSATQMRGLKDYYLFHCFVALRLAMTK
jgi:hypothetical protein